MNIQQSVKERYEQGAQAREEALCCPVDYDPQYLKIIPQEVLDKDYGCGDPSQYVRQGETVLDLGSGGGKICFIASQVVGKAGQVIGVDMTPDMLDMAKKMRLWWLKKLAMTMSASNAGILKTSKLTLIWLMLI